MTGLALAASWFVIVAVAAAEPRIAFTGFVSVSVKVSSGSYAVSPRTGTATVLVV
jgi:hypothetical protein